MDLPRSASENDNSEYLDLISCLPLSTISYAFAYGSGAIQQQNEKKEDKMVDYILATDKPHQFHQDNIRLNPSHYSLVRLLGHKTVARMQQNWAARVYYNTHVRVGKRLIKYGVISTDDLKCDLLDWRWIYVAGRLHKPVLDVISPSSSIADNLVDNRRSALQAALLLLPDTFSATELFCAIVGLSYTGDFRMIVGEDVNKINKIVAGNYEQLKSLYIPLLADDSRLLVKSNETIQQDASTPAIYHRLNLLPSEVLQRLQKSYYKIYRRQRDMEEMLFSLAHQHNVGSSVSSALSAIVAPVAISQTMKNFLSAGLTKSWLTHLGRNRIITSPSPVAAAAPTLRTTYAPEPGIGLSPTRPGI
ncbi:hypothetical protein WR25_21972 [Diploscapter pachys]|uniref:Phosphatidate cytidylyltransferase, mitochondrial n=1 Tax=Diploscapter pachys TaxID=2018661 RepID=A0A2A2L9F6_9BILA|nr:hypothetical protein WR25_21972 [Diploscapter pachys]